MDYSVWAFKRLFTVSGVLWFRQSEVFTKIWSSLLLLRFSHSLIMWACYINILCSIVFASVLITLNLSKVASYHFMQLQLHIPLVLALKLSVSSKYALHDCTEWEQERRAIDVLMMKIHYTSFLFETYVLRHPAAGLF